MKTPRHPGISVRMNCLEALNLSVTEGTRVLGVTRQALNNVVNGKSGISPDMAPQARRDEHHLQVTAVPRLLEAATS